jgi:hypothetical protein
MKLENQVCSLENAKKLAELGVKVESYFHYLVDEVTIVPSFKGYYVEAPAYTVAELVGLLPDGVYIYKDEDGWNAETQDSIVSFEVAENMADVCALMLCWRIENKHVDVMEGINQ